MNDVITLQDAHAAADLRVYLSRARLVDDTAVRLIAGGGVLAVYSAVLHPRGLLDTSPTILGLRTFAEVSGAAFDRVVAPAAISDRLAALSPDESPSIPLPAGDVRSSWSGIAPPRGGWQRVGSVSSLALELAARDGAGEVARGVPENTGDLLVQRVRSEVWSRPLAGTPDVPSGVAFAAASLGFLVGEEEVPIYASGGWLRVSPVRGHVLARLSRSL